MRTGQIEGVAAYLELVLHGMGIVELGGEFTDEAGVDQAAQVDVDAGGLGDTRIDVWVQAVRRDARGRRYQALRTGPRRDRIGAHRLLTRRSARQGGEILQAS